LGILEWYFKIECGKIFLGGLGIEEGVRGRVIRIIEIEVRFREVGIKELENKVEIRREESISLRERWEIKRLRERIKRLGRKRGSLEKRKGSLLRVIKILGKGWGIK
jgi:hypothetical protein